ncbi:SAM-dependent methyltransferase [Streptacidiphilus carbonis]|uniref:SAM-dependent methyltransferase n=1 Tax=Streptacidiphilus carbonis TaxID=105422 RepID=UPI0009FD95C1|nr:SAM-dependent methyltransferase [Streptacidiphilus carbonis]
MEESRQVHGQGADWSGWRAATERALYGSDGFFTRTGSGPGEHFRTSVHASHGPAGGAELFAGAVLGLVDEVDEALGRPTELVVTDVGAGRAELLCALGVRARAERPGLADRLVLRAVELAPRPDGLPEWIGWSDRIGPAAHGVLFANEWLDNVPVEIAEVDPEGVARLVEVERGSGEERLGAPVAGPEAAWLARWWPLDRADPGERAEIGLPRDLAWAAAVASLGQGLAVAVDYAHAAAARPPFGTLAAYREGREVRPVPDGSCDLTSHVALDSCLAAAAGTVHSLWTTQRDALALLGVHGARPPLALATGDPVGYLRALAGAGEAAELTAPGGLGSFVWGLQSVGMPLPGRWLDLARPGNGTLLLHDDRHADE